MKYLISGLGLLFTALMVRGMLAFLHRPRKAERGKVALPGFFAVLGLICALPFVAAAVYTALTDQPIWISIGFLAFSLLGLTLVVAYINCRITYDEDGFTHKSFFGIKRRYRYEDIRCVKYGNHEDFIYIGRRLLMVDEYSIGAIDFFATANKQYKSKFGTKIPEKPKGKQLFSPDVQTAGELICIWVCIGLLGFLLAGLCLYALLTAPPADPAETVMAWIIVAMSIIVPAGYIFITVKMARHPERFKEKTIRSWLYRDYTRDPGRHNHRKRH